MRSHTVIVPLASSTAAMRSAESAIELGLCGARVAKTPRFVPRCAGGTCKTIAPGPRVGGVEGGEGEGVGGLRRARTGRRLA